MRECLICKTEFSRRANEDAYSYKRRKTCGNRSCADKAAYQSRISRNGASSEGEPRECVICGTVFTPMRRATTCREKCTMELRARNAAKGGLNNISNTAYRVPAAELEANRKRAEAEYARFWKEEHRDYAGVHGET